MTELNKTSILNLNKEEKDLCYDETARQTLLREMFMFLNKKYPYSEKLINYWKSDKLPKEFNEIKNLLFTKKSDYIISESLYGTSKGYIEVRELNNDFNKKGHVCIFVYCT